MASVLETLTQQLGGGGLQKISGLLGSDEKKTGAAVAAALPMLLSALARNSRQKEGAQSLHSALEKDHDGSVLNNLSGLISDPASGNGDGILRHVLGNRRANVEKGLGGSTGLGAASAGKLLTMLAPVVMGALGQKTREEKMDAQTLAGFLTNEQRQAEERAPREMSAVERMLDSDGDGDVDLGDITKQGLGVLGKLFGK